MANQSALTLLNPSLPNMKPGRRTTVLTLYERERLALQPPAKGERVVRIGSVCSSMTVTGTLPKIEHPVV